MSARQTKLSAVARTLLSVLGGCRRALTRDLVAKTGYKSQRIYKELARLVGRFVLARFDSKARCMEWQLLGT